MWDKSNANLEAADTRNTSPQFVNQGGESYEDGIDGDRSNPRDNANRIDNSGEHSCNRCDSHLDLRKLGADQIGSLAQAGSKTLEDELAQEPR